MGGLLQNYYDVPMKLSYLVLYYFLKMYVSSIGLLSLSWRPNLSWSLAPSCPILSIHTVSISPVEKIRVNIQKTLLSFYVKLVNFVLQMLI